MCEFNGMDTPQLRQAYRQYRSMAQAVAPFENYTNADFLNDVKREMELRDLTPSPINWVICAEAQARSMAFVADEYNDWAEEQDRKRLDENHYMGYDTLEERAMDML